MMTGEKAVAHYLVELYSPNAAWHALSQEARQAFLAGIGQAMGSLLDMGVKVLTLGQTVPNLDEGSAYQYLGIWEFPAPEVRDALLAGIKASGWYQYFDHRNAATQTTSFEDHLTSLVQSV
jgi:hypothetical protein